MSYLFPWSYDIYLNVLKEFTNPHFRIFMLLSLMLILSLSGVEAALCRCITDVQLMCRFYFLLQISITQHNNACQGDCWACEQFGELVNSLWTVWYRLPWVRENDTWNIVQHQERSWVHWNTWRLCLLSQQAVIKDNSAHWSEDPI